MRFGIATDAGQGDAWQQQAVLLESKVGKADQHRLPFLGLDQRRVWLVSQPLQFRVELDVHRVDVRLDGVWPSAAVHEPEGGLELAPIGVLIVVVVPMSVVVELPKVDGELPVEPCRGVVVREVGSQLRPDKDHSLQAQVHVLDVVDVAVVHVGAGILR